MISKLSEKAEPLAQAIAINYCLMYSLVPTAVTDSEQGRNYLSHQINGCLHLCVFICFYLPGTYTESFEAFLLPKLPSY